MPDISQQMSYIQQLQDVRNPNSPMGALDRLGSSIGNAWQGYQGRTDEQDAVKFFMEKDVNPQTIQEFSATHPQMPLVDVYKTAGTLATQKKAQGMKDKMKTLTNAISSGAEMNEKLLPSLFPDATPAEMREFGTILTGMQQAGLNFKSLKEKDRFKPIGAQGLYDTETKGIIGQPAEKTTPLQDALRAKMLETNSDTGTNYTAAEAYRLVAHPVTPKEPKGPSRYGDFAEGYMAQLKADPKNAGKTDAELKLLVSKEADRLGIDKAVQVIQQGENVRANAQKGMLTEQTKEKAYEYLKTSGDLPPEIGRLFRIPYAQAELLNYVAQRQEEDGLTGIDRAANKAFYKGIGSSVLQQEKQAGAMGSFVKNMGAQIDRFETLSKDLSTFDARLLNVPLRSIRSKIVGTPLQSKLDLYLTEIEAEAGKLAYGSTASIAELSVEAQKKWDRIHDKNLSIADMLSLLKETQHAGVMRMKSVEDQLRDTENKMKGRGGVTNFQPFDKALPIKTKDGRDVKSLSDKELLKLLGQ